MMSRINRAARRQEGFTLVELLVVVGIIGVLAMLLLPQFRNMRDRARIASCQSNLKNIGTSLEAFYADRERYPMDATGTTNEWAALTAVGPPPGDLNRISTCPQNRNPYTYIANAELQEQPAGQANNFVVNASFDPNNPQAFAVTCVFHNGGAAGARFPKTVQLWVTDQGVGRKDL